MNELVGQINKGTDVSPKKMTVAYYVCNEWLPAMQAELKPSTYEGYRMNCEVHILPVLGGYELQKLTPGMLRSFYTQKLANGRRDGKGGLSPKTVGHLHGIVHKLLTDAVGWEFVSRNVANAVRPPKYTAPEMHVWSPEQTREFLTGVREDRLFAAWALLATSGMRRGELLGLRWKEDVDLEAGTVAVQEPRVRAGKEVVVSTPKTRAGRRVVALDAVTLAALRQWKVTQAKERLLIGPRYVESGLVVTMPDGSPVTPNRFSLWFRKHVARLGLPTIRLHDVRRSYATAALKAGVATKIVSERIGHASTDITTDRYQHVIPAWTKERPTG
jgi:integrase